MMWKLCVAANMSKYLNGLGGTVHGSFFRVPDAIDTNKPPGATSIDLQGGPKTPPEVAKKILSGAAFFYSPNLTWFLIASFLWWFVPYQLHDPLTDVLRQRLLVNHVVVLLYVGFWHVTLYWLGFAKRPFVPNRTYSWAKVSHNVFYTWLGIIQWTLTEVAFIYCYQTGRLAFVSDIFSSRTAFLTTALWSILVPAFRDVHFYFAHRLIHVKFLYIYIHSVHHRNNDIEPFSGLAMHPAEHLYYFTCYGPCLLIPHSPFILFWMGIHTVISPAASHSGYEDHFSADLYHYLHHRYNDCNYAGGIPFDRWFGTYRDHLKSSETRDPKATLIGLPENPLFLLFGILIPLATAAWSESINPHIVALIVSLGPCFAAALLFFAKKNPKSMLAPFDKDTLVSQIFHIGGGIVLGVLPATYLCNTVLS
jgi:sterol desaturase/sphingolipid hydroxylase (fatty acid hydroxylase superfamily)